MAHTPLVTPGEVAPLADQPHRHPTAEAIIFERLGNDRSTAS
jgi:hypothetical protein